MHMWVGFGNYGDIWKWMCGMCVYVLYLAYTEYTNSNCSTFEGSAVQ